MFFNILKKNHTHHFFPQFTFSAENCTEGSHQQVRGQLQHRKRWDTRPQSSALPPDIPGLQIRHSKLTPILQSLLQAHSSHVIELSDEADNLEESQAR